MVRTIKVIFQGSLIITKAKEPWCVAFRLKASTFASFIIWFTNISRARMKRKNQPY